MISREQYDALMDVMRDRKRAFQVTFKRGMAQDFVLRDLMKFCRARESTFHPDPRMHAVLEGRREVWLRIQNYLGLTEEELIAIYMRDPNKGEVK